MEVLAVVAAVVVRVVVRRHRPSACVTGSVASRRLCRGGPVEMVWESGDDLVSPARRVSGSHGRSQLRPGEQGWGSQYARVEIGGGLVPVVLPHG